MKWLWIIMGIFIVLAQFRIWGGEGSYAQVWDLQQQITAQRAENESLRERNEKLDAEVVDLKTGQDAIEERARSRLGMIKEGETFYLLIDDPATSGAQD